MSKINIRKYKYETGNEEVVCPHCKKIYVYNLKWHYEDRPKRKDGNLIIPLELVEVKCYDSQPPVLCAKCGTFKKCLDCDIILCNWKRHSFSYSSEENPNYCEGCLVNRISVYPHI